MIERLKALIAAADAGGWVEWAEKQAELKDAALDALPALIRVAEAAERVADMIDSGGAFEMLDLRAALAALDTEAQQ